MYQRASIRKDQQAIKRHTSEGEGHAKTRKQEVGRCYRDHGKRIGRAKGGDAL